MKKLIEPDILHMLRDSAASFYPDIFCIHHESLKNRFGIACVEINILTNEELKARCAEAFNQGYDVAKTDARLKLLDELLELVQPYQRIVWGDVILEHLKAHKMLIIK